MFGKKTSAIAISALAAAGVLAWSPPAAAASNSQNTGTAVRPAAAAPSCVKTSLDDSGVRDHLRVKNNCSYSVRVKVKLALGPDFSCIGMPVGSYHTYSWAWPAKFDGVDSC